MGVVGLSSYCKQSLRGCSNHVELGQGSSLVVDGSALIYHILKECTSSSANSCSDSTTQRPHYLHLELGCDYSALFSALSDYLSKLQKGGVELLVVLDGLHGEGKEDTVIQRRAAQIAAMREGLKALDNERAVRHRNCHGNSCSRGHRCLHVQSSQHNFCALLPLFAVETLVLVCKSLQIECSMATREADQAIVTLCRERGSLALSNDSDFLVYDIEGYIPFWGLVASMQDERVVGSDDSCRDGDVAGNEGVVIGAHVFRRSKLAAVLGIEPAQIAMLACLVGNDVTSTMELDWCHQAIFACNNSGGDGGGRRRSGGGGGGAHHQFKTKKSKQGNNSNGRGGKQQRGGGSKALIEGVAMFLRENYKDCDDRHLGTVLLTHAAAGEKGSSSWRDNFFLPLQLAKEQYTLPEGANSGSATVSVHPPGSKKWANDISGGEYDFAAPADLMQAIIDGAFYGRIMIEKSLTLSAYCVVRHIRCRLYELCHCLRLAITTSTSTPTPASITSSSGMRTSAIVSTVTAAASVAVDVAVDNDDGDDGDDDVAMEECDQDGDDVNSLQRGAATCDIKEYLQKGSRLEYSTVQVSYSNGHFDPMNVRLCCTTVHGRWQLLLAAVEDIEMNTGRPLSSNRHAHNNGGAGVDGDRTDGDGYPSRFSKEKWLSLTDDLRGLAVAVYLQRRLASQRLGEEKKIVPNDMHQALIVTLTKPSRGDGGGGSDDGSTGGDGINILSFKTEPPSLHTNITDMRGDCISNSQDDDDNDDDDNYSALDMGDNDNFDDDEVDEYDYFADWWTFVQVIIWHVNAFITVLGLPSSSLISPLSVNPVTTLAFGRRLRQSERQLSKVKSRKSDDKNNQKGQKVIKAKGKTQHQYVYASSSSSSLSVGRRRADGGKCGGGCCCGGMGQLKEVKGHEEWFAKTQLVMRVCGFVD